jgi:rare lipoprotein A
MRHLVVAVLCAGLAACAGAPRKSDPPAAPVAVAPTPLPAAPSRCEGVRYAPAQEDLSKRGDYVAGGLFRPGERDSIPVAVPDVECIPEPQVVALERSKLGNRPVYTVLDRPYRVLDDTRGFVEEGLASYYGQKFHGRRTSNWEVYDMYAFTAAHKTLPLPSFARVTNLANGRSVVVRVNDRGPFHEGRVVDLSFAAAVKLGVYPAGTGRVRVEALQPGDAAAQPALAAPAPTAAPGGHRFGVDAAQPAGSADRFEAWMKDRNVRVATGTPLPVAPPAVAVETLPPPAAPAPSGAAREHPVPAVASMRAPPAPAVAIAAEPTPPAAPVTLQVASFSARDNADRALASLQRAGITDARLLDVQVAGQPLWRLRVGPFAAAAEPDVVARLAGLGFASPRRVAD